MRTSIKLFILVLAFFVQAHAQWQNVGPEGGYVRAMLANNGYVYALTDQKLFRMAENGTTWQALVAAEVSGRSLGDIIFAQNKITLSEPYTGIYQSADDGLTWQKSQTPQDQWPFSKLAADQNRMCAGVPGQGVVISTDGGGTWVQKINGLTDLNVNQVAFVNGRIFAATNSGLFLHDDAADQWTLLTIPGQWVSGLFGINEKVFISLSNGRFVSADNGNTWTDISMTLQNPFTSALNRNGVLYAWGQSQFSRTNDNGATWSSPQMIVSPPGMALSFAGSGLALYAGTYGSGVFKSIDDGLTWTAFSQNMRVRLIASMESDGMTVYAGDQNGEFFATTDLGQSWFRKAWPTPSMIRSILLDGSSILVSGWGVQKSTDGGSSWSSILSDMMTYSLLRYGGDLVVGGQGVVKISHDNGATWSTLGTGLPPNYSVLALVQSSSGLYAGTQGGGVFMYDAGTNTWVTKNSDLNNLYVQTLCFVGPKLLAGTQNGLYQSLNQGQTWQMVASFNPTTITRIRYLGSVVFAATSNGIRFSADDGIMWIDYSSGLQIGNDWSAMYDQDVAVTNNYIFTGTYGASVQRNALPSVVYLTFQVNMGVQIQSSNFNPATMSVVVRGDFQHLIGQYDWSGNSLVLSKSDNNESIYTIKFAVLSSTANSTIHFKYVIVSPSGEIQESIANRSYTVTSDVEQLIPVDYFNGQTVPSFTHNVTFQADLSDLIAEGFNDATDMIEVRGNAPLSWSPGIQLSKSTSNPNIYTRTISLNQVVGTVIPYQFHADPEAKFTNNGWENTGQRSFTFQDNDMVLPLVKPAIGLTNPTSLPAPVLALPVNGATEQGTSQIVTWYPVGSASSYRIQVADNQGFVSPAFDQTNNWVGTVAYGMSINKTYYWRVKALTGSIESPWSAVWSYTTIKNYPAWAPSDSFHVDITLPSDGTDPRAVIAGITRQDGKVRIVGGTQTTGRLFFYVYDGTTYQQEWSGVIAAGASIIPTAIGDCDNDGIPEILVNIIPNQGNGPSDGKVHVFKWNGSSYAQSFEFQLNTYAGTMPAVIADFDGDGKKEVAVLDGEVNVLKYSASAGNFQKIWSTSGFLYNLTYTNQIVAGDVDGDGRQEIVALPRLDLYSQNPAALTGMLIIGYNGSSYQIKAQLSGFLQGLGGVAIADFDGDGKAEMITGVTDYPLGSYPIYLVKNIAGNYVITQIGTSGTGLYQVHSGDFDGNGTVDADILRGGGSYAVFYRGGRYEVTFASHSTTWGLGDLADVDQDGKAEIVSGVTNGVNVVSWALPAPLPAPLLSLPANGATGQPTNINLQWNAVTGATTYDVQLSADQAFPSSSQDSGPISQTSFNFSNLALSTTYYWHVRASNSTQSPWSSTWSFTTGNGALAAPVLAQPANGSADQGLCINLIWNPVSGATSYRLQVSTTSTFQQTIVDQSNIGTSWGGITVAPGTTWYWRVCATNGTATSNWSDTWSFTTLSNLPVIPVSSAFHIDASFTINGTDIRGAIAGDTRGDGKVRIVAGTRTTGTLYVYLYDGTNYQLEWSGVIVPGAEIIPSVIGDADNDGKPEILVNVWPTPGYGPSDAKIHMLRWNGTGYAQVLEQQTNVGTSYLPAVIGDLDGDNKKELVIVGDQVNVLRYSQSSGTFETVWATTSTSYTFNNSIQVSLGDVDGDNRPEIVASVSEAPFNPNPSTAVALVIIGFNGSTYQVKAELSGFVQGLGGVAIADFDGDHQAEMIAGVFNYCVGTYPIYLIKHIGTGYTTTQLSVSPCGMFQARAADIDGDGLPDAEIFRNSGGSYFITYKAGAYQVALVQHSGATVFGDLGDTDNDGRAEIISDGDIVSYIPSATLPPPVLVSPSNSATGQSPNVALQWNPVTGATTYTVEVATDQLFHSIVAQSGPITGTMFGFSYPQLSYRTTYYWHVNASNPTLTSLWSAPWSFTTLTPVLPPAKTSWTYVKDFTNLTGGFGVQGLAVDPAGKVWIAPYDATEQVQTPNGIQSSRAIYVYTPDGNPVSFSPIKFITVNSVTDTLFSSSRGLSTDPNGNILYSANSVLYRINYRTGEGMARVVPQGFVTYATLTAPAVDQTGDVFVGRVWPGEAAQVFSPSFSLLGKIMNASTGFSRTIAASKDGKNVYWPEYDLLKLWRYTSANGAAGPYTNGGSIFDGLAIESMTWHPKTGFLWVSSGSEYNQPAAPYPILAWYGLDLANGNIADTIAWNQTPGTLSGRPRAIAFSPTGDTAYVGCFFLNANYVQVFHKVVQLSAYAASGATSTLNDLSNSEAQLTLTGGTGGVSVLMTSSVQLPPATPPLSGQGLVNVGKYLDVSAFGSIQWPLLVKMYYTANDLTQAGIFEDEILGMSYLRASTNQWILYSQSGADDEGRGPSTTWVDPTNVVVGGVQYEGVVYANEYHLTPMALAGKLKSASVRFDEMAAYVTKLPDDAFKKPADQRRSTLIDKLQRSKSQYTSGNVKGATQSVQQDILNHLTSNGNSGNDLWVTDETARLTLVRLCNELLIVMQRPQSGVKDFQAGEVEQASDVIPTDFTLYQNYPNPFNPSTRITFDLPKNSQVNLIVYNVLGQVVSRLVEGPLSAGTYSLNFVADRLSAGIYYYVLTANDFRATKKMVLLK